MNYVKKFAETVGYRINKECYKRSMLRPYLNLILPNIKTTLITHLTNMKISGFGL